MTRLPLNAIALCVVNLVCMTPLLRADTIFLSSGGQMEGTILREGDTTIEVEVQVSSSIKEVRSVPKAEIVRVEKPDPVVQAYEKLKNIQLQAHSMALADYDRVLKNMLEPFLAAYPLSSQAGEVKKIADQFSAERQKVSEGWLKIGGEWYSPAQVEKNRAQIQAQLAFRQMQSASASGDVLGALNIFSKLEKQHKGSRVYPDAILLARSLIPAVRKEIASREVIFERDMKDREDGLALTPDYRRQELIQAAEKEKKQVEAALDAAKRNGVVWTPIYPRSRRSLDDLTKTTETESKRLESLKVDNMKASIAAADVATAALGRGDLVAAESAFQEATKLWNENLTLKESLQLLATTRTQKAAAVKETPKPVAAASPTPRKTNRPAAGRPVVAVGAAAEEEKSWLMTFPGILSVAVLAGAVGAGVFLFGRSKKGRPTADIH